MPERKSRVKPSFRDTESEVSEATLKGIVGDTSPDTGNAPANIRTDEKAPGETVEGNSPKAESAETRRKPQRTATKDADGTTPQRAAKETTVKSESVESAPTDGMVLKTVDRSQIQTPVGTQPARSLDTMSNSAKQHGLIQPLVVRQVGNEFQVVLGRQRLLAADRAGITRIPVVVQEMDDDTYAAINDEHKGPPFVEPEKVEPEKADVTLREPEDPATVAIEAMQALLASTGRPTALQRRQVKALAETLTAWVYRFGPLPLS